MFKRNPNGARPTSLELSCLQSLSVYYTQAVQKPALTEKEEVVHIYWHSTSPPWLQILVHHFKTKHHKAEGAIPGGRDPSSSSLPEPLTSHNKWNIWALIISACARVKKNIKDPRRLLPPTAMWGSHLPGPVTHCRGQRSDWEHVWASSRQMLARLWMPSCARYIEWDICVCVSVHMHYTCCGGIHLLSESHAGVSPYKDKM